MPRWEGIPRLGVVICQGGSSSAPLPPCMTLTHGGTKRSGYENSGDASGLPTSLFFLDPDSSPSSGSLTKVCAQSGDLGPRFLLDWVWCHELTMIGTLVYKINLILGDLNKVVSWNKVWLDEGCGD